MNTLRLALVGLLLSGGLSLGLKLDAPDTTERAPVSAAVKSGPCKLGASCK